MVFSIKKFTYVSEIPCFPEYVGILDSLDLELKQFEFEMHSDS